MQSQRFRRVLVLAPHTDDGEIGCGGALCRFAEEGHRVYYAALSHRPPSLPPGMPEDVLRRELLRAAEVLGIPGENVFLFDFPVRSFSAARQEILSAIVDLRDRIGPDLVFLPSPGDMHQDHETVAREGLRVFRKCTLLGYEEPWNNVTFQTRGFIPLEERHIAKKVEALLCYRSQRHRIYLNEDFVRSLAVTRGVQIGVPYAEAFEVLRWVLGKGPLP